MLNTTSATNTTPVLQVEIHNMVMYKQMQIAFMMILIITGLSVNTMLIVLAVLRRRYILLSNMAVSNYIAITVLSLRVVNLMLKEPNDGVQHPEPNVLLLALTELWWTTQNYTLVVISYQRYKLIREPFHASRYITKCYKSVAIAGMWAVSVILVLVLEGGKLISYRYDPNILRYRKDWEDHPWYTIFYFFICFLLPGLMLNYFQGYMYYKGRKSKRREHRPFRERTTSFSSSMRRHSHQSESTHNGRRLGSLSTYPSSDLSGILSTRKRKLSDSKLKPLFSTLLIVIPYILAVVPEVILMFMYSNETSVIPQEVDIIMGNTKYLIIAYFPIILCVTDSEVRYNIRRVINKLKCCRSGRIGNINIDSRDYPENVSRRDSRRNSVVSQQSNINNNNFHISTEEHSVTPPRVKQEIRYKSSSANSSPTNSDTMTNLFFISTTPINFPDVQT